MIHLVVVAVVCDEAAEAAEDVSWVTTVWKRSKRSLSVAAAHEEQTVRRALTGQVDLHRRE